MKICLTLATNLNRELLDLSYIAEFDEFTDSDTGVKEFIYHFETTGGSEGYLHTNTEDLISLLMCGSYPVKVKGFIIWEELS